MGAVRADAAASASADRAAASTYRFDPAAIAIEDGRFATEQTHVTFQRHDGVGRRARGCRFTSRAATGRKATSCWPASSPTSARRPAPVAFGGRGEFDGAMTGAFRRPRVEGRLHRRGPARVGHALGRRRRAHRRREQLRRRQRRRRPRSATRRSAPTGCSRSAIRATTAARRSTRDSASRGAISIRLRHAFEHRRLSGVRPAVGRVPPDRAHTSGRSASAR